MNMQGGEIVAAPLIGAIDVRDLQRWGRTAKPRDRIVFAAGQTPPRASEAWIEAKAMYDRGEVTLGQCRREWGWDWIAIRLEETVVIAPHNRLSAATDGDDAFDRVIKAIKRAANLERVCPTNTELARMCGLKDVEAAKYLIRCAISRNMIKVEDRRPKSRVVTIVGTGRSTLAD